MSDIQTTGGRKRQKNAQFFWLTFLLVKCFFCIAIFLNSCYVLALEINPLILCNLSPQSFQPLSCNAFCNEFSKLSVPLCVCVCTPWMWCCVSVCMPMCIYVGQRLMSDFFLKNSISWDSFSLNLELTNLARLAGKPLGSTYLIFAPQHWDYKYALPCPVFTWVLVIWTQVLTLSQQTLNSMSHLPRLLMITLSFKVQCNT